MDEAVVKIRQEVRAPVGKRNIADGDCSHEIKRHLFHGRKAMTNLNSILKSRVITLQTKFHLVKAMVFPIVMYIQGLMLKLKLQYFGHLMRRTDSLEKTLNLGKIEGRRRRAQQSMS